MGDDGRVEGFDLGVAGGVAGVEGEEAGDAVGEHGGDEARVVDAPSRDPVANDEVFPDRVGAGCESL